MAKVKKNNNNKNRSRRSTIKKPKILVTGSEGFIGSPITKELLKKKYDVYGIGTKKRNITNYKYFSLDLLNKKNLYVFFKKHNFESIIHTAWVTNPNTMRHSLYYEKWLKISKIILDLHISNNGKKFYCIGTSDEYKRIKNIANYCVENKSKIMNLNNYAKNKILFYDYLKSKKIQFVWFRVFWLFGDKEKKQRLFPQIIQKLENRKIAQIDNPEIGLDYTNVKYAAKMIVKVISNKKTRGVFNICSGKILKIRKIAEKIGQLMNKKRYLIFLKSKTSTSVYGSITKLKNIDVLYRVILITNLKNLF